MGDAIDLDIPALFETAVANSGLGLVERLPKTCQATHVFRLPDSDKVLPLKLVIEDYLTSVELAV